MVRDTGRTHNPDQGAVDWQRRRIKEMLTFVSIEAIWVANDGKCHDTRVNIIPHISAVQASVAVKLLRHIFFRLFTFLLDKNGQLNYNIDITEPKAWI